MSNLGYRNREIINLDSSDEESIAVVADPGAVAAPAVRKPSAPSNEDKDYSLATKARRRFSIDSLSDSSSGSLEELLQKASITERLLAKPPAIVNLDGFDLSGSSSSSPPKPSSSTSGVIPATDPPPLGSNVESSNKENFTQSAWLVDEITGDFILSKEKCSDKDWPNLALPATLYQGLYEFQRQAVQWMAGLHSDHSGGALCDDMGMGKTVTTLALIGGLMRANSIQTALVIAPLSVLQSWETTARNILRQCLPSIKVTVLNSDISQYRRQDIIQSLKTKDRDGRFATYDLVITTYGLVRSATPDFMSHSIRVWDYVILDEGHQIKNHTSATSQACRKICSTDTHRLLLTGTPIMNNLKELWSVFDFATQGKILGTLKTFNQYYGRHIEAARDRRATEGIIVLGQTKNEELQNVIRPYFLQRLKKDHLKDKLPKKHDVVVWTTLSNKQRQLYLDFVNSKDSIVRSILTGAVTSPLEAITWLKKLCGHPLLIEATGTCMDSLLSGVSTAAILEQSAKLQVLLELVASLRQRGRRMLIFSQSTKMLDTIAAVLNTRFQLSRIDGSTPGRDRQRLVDEFNKDDSRYDAMLLSTKAAGCGLTLIGADTSIIYDPYGSTREIK
jgi:SNF2 family DNA or RNA helicase